MIMLSSDQRTSHKLAVAMLPQLRWNIYLALYHTSENSRQHPAEKKVWSSTHMWGPEPYTLVELTPSDYGYHYHKP